MGGVIEKKRGLIRIIKVFVVILVGYFVWKVFSHNFSALKGYHFQIDWPYLYLSVLIVIVYFFLQSCLWHFLLKEIGVHVSWWISFRAWFYSLPGKYVPGKVGYALGRIYFYNGHRVPATKITFGLYLEALFILISSTIIVCVTLPFISFEYPRGFLLGVFGFFFLLMIFIQPSVLETIINVFLKRLSLEEVQIKLRFRQMIIFLVGHTLIQGILGGFFLFFLIKGFNSPQPMGLATAAAINNAVAIFGQIMFVFPGGIGVREGAYTFLLGHVVPAPLPLVVSLAARLVITAVEIGLAGVLYMFPKWRKNNDNHRDS